MKRNNPKADTPGALSPVVYHILLVLGNGSKHGYAMMQEIRERTGGSVEVLPGTLYSTIKRMLAEGLIAETEPPPEEAGSDERRRYYRLTERGREVGISETERMSRLVRLARRQGFVSAR